MYGAFFCHMGSLLLLSRKTLQVFGRARGGGEKSVGLQRLLLAAQWLAYLWHVVCGILYFGKYMTGAMYY